VAAYYVYKGKGSEERSCFAWLPDGRFPCQSFFHVSIPNPSTASACLQSRSCFHYMYPVNLTHCCFRICAVHRPFDMSVLE
jgi:hypothetical protein